MKLSIIIPALEEEKYLPFLLNSIKAQNFLNSYEIIVADGGSKDKTIEIAKKYNCKITKGGLPAKGRNEGAKIAKGDLLLFLDADTILPGNSLNKFIFEFKKRNLDIAGFLLKPWLVRNILHNDIGRSICFISQKKVKEKESYWLKFLYSFFYNFPILLLEKILPHSVGAVLIKKSIYLEISGFDESIVLGEDHCFARKAKKIGKFGILRSSKIFYSQRRFKRDGLIKTYFKYLLAELYLVFFGPIKSDIFKYDLHSRRFID